MTAAGGDDQAVAFLLVDKAVGFVNPPAPVAVVVFQRLRFSDAAERIPLRVLYQLMRLSVFLSCDCRYR